MAEEANTDVKDNVEMNTTEEESSTAKTNDDGVIAITIDEDNKPKEDNDSEGKTEDVDTKGEQEKATEAEATKENSEDNSRKNAERRKQQLNNEIRDKVAERNALRKEIAELNQQKFQMKNASDIPSVENLMSQVNPETGDYFTRTEAKVARMEAERQLEQAQKKLDELLDNEITAEAVTLKEATAKALADKLYEAMDGWGTDEAAIYEVMNEMNTRSDVVLLIKTFGVRDGKNLVQWITSELNAKDRAQVNNILATNNVNYKF